MILRTVMSTAIIHKQPTMTTVWKRADDIALFKHFTHYNCVNQPFRARAVWYSRKIIRNHSDRKTAIFVHENHERRLNFEVPVTTKMHHHCHALST